MIVRIDPPLPVDSSKGKGEAYFLLDYGQEHHVIWCVGVTETREFWWLPNPEVKLRDNPTMGRLSAVKP